MRQTSDGEPPTGVSTILPWIRATASAARAEQQAALDTLADFGKTLLLAALFTLGLLSVVSSDFAFQWQPVPEGIPGRALLARVIGAALMGMATGALSPRWRTTCTFDLAVLLTMWLVLLQGARLIGTPLAVGSWNDTYVRSAGQWRYAFAQVSLPLPATSGT